MTLDDLARSLRGMPRGAPMLVRMPDGSLRPLVSARPARLLKDGTEAGNAVDPGQTIYTIVLVVGAGGEPPRSPQR
jgi:hypothetical protein